MSNQVNITNCSISSSSSSSSSSLVKVIAESLLTLIEENKRLVSYGDPLTERQASPFYSAKPPLISIHKYLIRIVEKTEIGESTIVIALIYLDRLFREHNVIIDEYTIHRLIITSILLAIKYNEDVLYKQSFYARVAGITKRELDILETQMLKTIDYKLYVDTTVYDTYKNYFEAFLPQMKESSFFYSKQLMCL